jgi:hypothetical protein
MVLGLLEEPVSETGLVCGQFDHRSTPLLLHGAALLVTMGT